MNIFEKSKLEKAIKQRDSILSSLADQINNVKTNEERMLLLNLTQHEMLQRYSEIFMCEGEDAKLLTDIPDSWGKKTKKFFLEVLYNASWNFHTLDYQHRWSDELPRMATYRLINIYQNEAQEYSSKKDWQACQSSCEQQVEKAQKVQDTYFQAMGLLNLAIAKYYQNNIENGRANILEAIRLCDAGIRSPKSEKDMVDFMRLREQCRPIEDTLK